MRSHHFYWLVFLPASNVNLLIVIMAGITRAAFPLSLGQFSRNNHHPADTEAVGEHAETW